VAFQRARQLQAGARPRVESASHSPTRLALLEVLADTISWTVVPVAENAVNKDG
jgi:DNA-directed RNA polymerase subunit K/omega